MTRSQRIAVAVVAVLAVAATAAPAAADVRITGHAYVRHDGGMDASIASCSDMSPGTLAGGRRQANEPAASVDPADADRMTAGANDYCTVPTTTDAWAGFYYSSNRGATWTNSLLPGYPTDTSAEGQASPLFGFVRAAGDPVQAWDNQGHLYYAGIAFNRTLPQNGSIWIARYTWPMATTAPDYEFTTIVSRGTPGFGHFEDKVQLEVDKGADSPHAGNVYVCWARFTGSPANNCVQLATSRDGGRTFRVQKISEGVHGSQFCDIAVTRDGTVYVAWRQFAFKPDRGQQQADAVAWVKSTNGGRSFTKPAIATEFLAWDPGDHFGSPAAAGRALYDACLAADATIGNCLAGPEPRTDARNCGDGPLVCQSGYVFFRANTQVRITADPTPAGNPNAVYVVYDGSVPGSQTPTGTSYGTAGTGVGTQAAVYFLKTENGGGSWTAPARIDPQASGHQFFPDVDADSGVLHAVWQDSRNDCARGPAGGDFRTVPIANAWTAANPPGGVVCSTAAPGAPGAAGVDAVYATSSNGGAAWTASVVSDARTMPQYEQFGDRDLPFFGDYNYVDAAAGAVLLNWTDQRDVVPGVDPRYPVDGMDGFDVLQCRAPTNGGFGPDTCPNAGGLDQNIYGLVVSLP